MKKFMVLLFIAVVLMLYGCGEKRPKAEHAGPADKITLGVYAGLDSLLVYIAQDRGFFKKAGLDVAIKEYEAGKLACDALIKDEVDICASSEFVFVSNSFDHEDIRILGTVSSSSTNEVVARKDRHINSPRDLAGKRIGVTKKSVAEFYLGTFLVFNGISPEEVEIVDLKPSELISAIAAGTIDASFIWNPNVYYMKEQLGDNAISWPGQSGQNYYFVLIAKEGFVKKNKDIFNRLIKAIIEAENYVEGNKGWSKEFTGKQFNYNTKLLDSIWQNHDFDVSLPQALIMLMEDEARWRIKNALTDKKEIPNYLEFIYMDALKEEAPEKVGIIR